MKKLMMIAAAAALITGSAFAQKPVEGSLTLETQLHFQTGTAPVSFVTPNIRVRYFLSDALAARVQFAYLSGKNTMTFNEKADGSGSDGTVKQSNGQFTFRPGIEKHFAGTTKLSPYVGAELNLQFGNAKEEWDQASAFYDPNGNFLGYGYEKSSTAKIEGDWATGTPTYAAGTTFGLNLVGGVDYYFWDHMYIGAELGWGINSFKGKDTKATETYDDGTGTLVTNEFKSKGDKVSGFTMLPSSFVRIGWMIK